LRERGYFKGSDLHFLCNLDTAYRQSSPQQSRLDSRRSGKNVFMPKDSDTESDNEKNDDDSSSSTSEKGK
jgi:hypothetical protein